MPNFSLRYDATFKVSKFESSLFYKIVLHVVVVLHVCKKLPLALDCSWSKYSFPMLFPVLEFLAVKKTELIFCCIVLLHLWAQKVCLRFLKPCFRLELLIVQEPVKRFSAHLVHKMWPKISSPCLGGISWATSGAH